MISIPLSSSLCPVSSHCHRPILNIFTQPSKSHFCSYYLKCHKCPSLSTTPSSKGKCFVVSVEDVVEKDWSFLDNDNGEENYNQNIDRIISAGGISDNSKVLISISSEEFVDRVVDSSPSKQVLVVHDSLFALACIKEKYDDVQCWQGELVHVPEKWAPFDAVFIYFLPAIPFALSQVLDTLGKRSVAGARIVISHPQGRQMLEEQCKQFPDVIVSNLPDMETLQDVAVKNSFQVLNFVDEPGFYLAVLKFNGGA
ncbi:unnamed protein product [Cuscuta campestris]|nr:unnamed protein product [Cuscuta campestris]